MQQTQEAAAETETQSHGGFRRVDQGGIVELELVERVAQFGELGVVDREQAGIDHRLGVAVAGQRLSSRSDGRGQSVAHLGLAHIFRTGDDVADFAGAERLGSGHVGADHADFNRIVGHANTHHVHFFTVAQFAVFHTNVSDDATVGVVDGIKDKRAGGRFGIAVRSRHIHDDLVK